jgi:hypothetical protein
VFMSTSVVINRLLLTSQLVTGRNWVLQLLEVQLMLMLLLTTQSFKVQDISIFYTGFDLLTWFWLFDLLTYDNYLILTSLFDNSTIVNWVFIFTTYVFYWSLKSFIYFYISTSLVFRKLHYISKLSLSLYLTQNYKFNLTTFYFRQLKMFMFFSRAHKNSISIESFNLKQKRAYFFQWFKYSIFSISKVHAKQVSIMTQWWRVKYENLKRKVGWKNFDLTEKSEEFF